MFTVLRKNSHSTIDDAILSSLGEAVVAFDARGRCIVFNKEAERLLVQSETDALGKSALHVFPLVVASGRLFPKHTSPIERVVASRQTYRSKMPPNVFVKNHLGHVFPIDVTISATNPRGKSAIVAVFQDMTSRMEMDRMKSDFVSLVSHQLRTPLSATRWFLEVLLKGIGGPLNAKQENFAHSAMESTNRMIRLVNTLLNISRLESGKMKVTPVKTNCVSFLKSLIQEMTMVARAHNVSLRFISSVRSLVLPVDRDLLREVVNNLVTNAIQYSTRRKEESRVFVRLSMEGSRIAFTVEDNGIGIPEKDQFHLFTKFYRASNAQKHVVDGNGLGLFTVKKILDETGGSVHLQSQEGKGTTFVVRFPKSGMKKRSGTRTFAR